MGAAQSYLSAKANGGSSIRWTSASPAQARRRILPKRFWLGAFVTDATNAPSPIDRADAAGAPDSGAVTADAGTLRRRSMIGVFRPSDAVWSLDANDNGRWDGCGVDRCTAPFGGLGDIPVVGYW